jgi:RHS repeat-associated protein
VEKQNGSVVSTKKFLWCGTGLSEERDSTGGTVTKRYFGQGEQISGTNYFFTADHLGSIREMTDSTGAIRARYDYDAYGRRTKASGDIEADFAFTGHYYHTVSGMYLTLFRAYDAETGRWISRDPIEEGGGLNLYNYVQNNPINAVDPLGLISSSLDGLVGAHAVDIAFLFAVPLPGLVADTGLSFLWYWGHECSFGDSVLNAGRDLLVQLVLGKAVGEMAPVFMSVLGKAGVIMFGSSPGKAAAKSVPRWTAQDFVQEVATRSESRIGGAGAVAGTEKHAYAAELIERYQSRFGPVGGGLATEQSYLAGAYLGRSVNLPGSVRLDVVEGALTSPSAVFDFKFTINPNPVLSPNRINRIRANAGLGPNVPINVVHP